MTAQRQESRESVVLRAARAVAGAFGEVVAVTQ